MTRKAEMGTTRHEAFRLLATERVYLLELRVPSNTAN